jgi:hypothetical protein
MKRRHAIQTLAAAAVAKPVFSEQAAPARGVDETPKLETAVADAGATPVAHFFSPAEFATLRRLSQLLMPAAKGNPGALEAGAPEFLDFLISQSPLDRQSLYREGLDRLESDARRGYFTHFAELSAEQADAVLAPLHAAWTYAGPTDPLGRFLAEAKADVMTATTNSREWIAAQAGRSRRAAGVDYYWLPVD